MKTAIILLALFSVACAEVSRREVGVALIQAGQDGCLTCVDDIMNAVAECSDDGINLLQCVTDILGAASDCLHCICEILAIIGGFEDICP